MPLLPVDRSHDGHSSPVMLSECRPTIGAGSTPTPRHTNPSGVLLHEPTQAFLLNEASSRIRVSGANASSAIVSPGWRNAPGEDDPPSFPPEVAIEVKAIACELPSRLGLPLSRLFVPDIRAEVLTRGLVAEISGTTIWRWLATDAIRPWAYRSWIFPRDPDFEPKEHEYDRGGALAHFAAWDVHQAKIPSRSAQVGSVGRAGPSRRGVAGRPEPQRQVGRLHRLVDDLEQLAGEGLQVQLLPEPAAERRDRLGGVVARSEEHTSELQSRPHLVCRLLL